MIKPAIRIVQYWEGKARFSPLKAELNPICHMLALLGVHHIFHVSGLRVSTVMDGTDKQRNAYIMNG